MSSVERRCNLTVFSDVGLRRIGLDWIGGLEFMETFVELLWPAAPWAKKTWKGQKGAFYHFTYRPLRITAKKITCAHTP